MYHNSKELCEAAEPKKINTPQTFSELKKNPPFSWQFLILPLPSLKPTNAEKPSHQCPKNALLVVSNVQTF